MAPCSHPRMKMIFSSIGKKRTRHFRPFGLVSLLVKRSMRQGGLILAAVSLCSKKKKETHTHTKKPRRIQNTRRIPQQPGDRDLLEMARDGTRPTR